MGGCERGLLTQVSPLEMPAGFSDSISPHPIVSMVSSERILPADASVASQWRFSYWCERGLSVISNIQNILLLCGVSAVFQRVNIIIVSALRDFVTLASVVDCQILGSLGSGLISLLIKWLSYLLSIMGCYSPTVVLPVFPEHATEISWIPSVRPPPVPDSFSWLLIVVMVTFIVMVAFSTASPRAVTQVPIRHAAEIRRPHLIRPPPDPDSIRHALIVVSTFWLLYFQPSHAFSPHPSHQMPISDDEKHVTSRKKGLVLKSELNPDAAEYTKVADASEYTKAAAEYDTLLGSFQKDGLTSTDDKDESKPAVDDGYYGGCDADADGEAHEFSYGGSGAEMDGFGVANPAGMDAFFARLAVTMAQALKAADSTASSGGLGSSGGSYRGSSGGSGSGAGGGSKPKESTTTINGMEIRDVPRTIGELDGSRVQISKHDRGSNPESRKKTRDRYTGALANKLVPFDPSKITGHGSGGDFGKDILQKQTAWEKLVSWAKSVDCFGVANVPIGVDFHDKHAVAHAHCINIFDNPTGVDIQSARKYQRWINTYLPAVEVESCEWIYDCLYNSTDATVLIEIKQTFDSFPKEEQGGIVLLVLIAAELYKTDDDTIRLLQDFIRQFKLSDVPGENVSVAAARFKAAVILLPNGDLPSDLLRLFVTGMSHCGNEEFKSICGVQKAFLLSPMVDDWNAANPDVRLRLEAISGKLVKTYKGMYSRNEWSASTDSSFNVSTGAVDHSHSYVQRTRGGFAQRRPPQAPPAPLSSKNQGKARPPNPSWQKWFDSQKCTVPGCGKNHPPKYHNDPGIRNRPYIPNPRNNRVKGGYSPRFKSGGSQERLKKSIYQAVFENLDFENEEECEEFMANMAGDEMDVDAEPADEEPDREEDEVHLAENTDDAAYALASIGLDQLLNFC